MSSDEMEFGFREPAAAYVSGSQKARVWTERWVSEWLYCPNCGNSQINQFTANLPVADFYCPSCHDQYELKSQKKPFGKKIANGAYKTKIERLASAKNPNLMLLNYDAERKSVQEICIVPKHFFVPEIVEERTPLAPTARRAGWIGSNILLWQIPQAGRIQIVKSGAVVPKDRVLEQWRQTVFLRDQSIESRGWLMEVMKCVDVFGDRDFYLNEVYLFELSLAAKYPKNNNIRAKIRQQLQILRDSGYIDFVSPGHYRRIPK